MTIGERIKLRREQLGLTQDELATKCGYKSRSSINKIELSRALPLQKIELMANALQTTPSDLMGWGEGSEFVKKPIKNPKKSKADKLYEKYINATPKIRKVVDLLLDSHEQDS